MRETGRICVVAVAFLALTWVTVPPRSLEAHPVHDPQDDILESSYNFV